MLGFYSYGLPLLGLMAATVSSHAQPQAHYDMQMHFDALAGSMTATVTVTLPAAQGETDFILGDRFALDRVKVGRDVQVAVTPTDNPIPHLHRIAVHFPAGAPSKQRIAFTYHGPLNEPDDSLPALSPKRIELDIETMWLPVREDLGMEFSVDADLTGLPESLVVIPQGQFERRGSRLHVHRQGLDADLLIDGAVGLTLVKGADVDFYAADQSDPLVAMMRKHAFGAAAFYRQLYGAPDPAPITMVIVPRGNGAGYARRSFVVMPTFRKFGDPTPPFDESSVARFVSHEFRHAWKANIKGLDNNNAWISESIAEYFALRYAETALGDSALETVLERKRKAAEGAGALTGVDTKPNSRALYQKGPLLLFELEDQIGRPALDRILVQRDPPLSTQAFITALSEVAGPEVAKTFEAKLR